MRGALESIAVFPRPAIVMVTDRRRYGGTEAEQLNGLIEAIARAASAGVDLIQIRERGLTDAALFALVKSAMAQAPRSRVLVNERTDVALAAGAAGVHLRSSCPPAARVRTIVPPGFLIGRSIHSRGEAEGAARDGGCDYLLFGTTFPSTSKPAGHRVAGLEALRAVCTAVQLPVLAIGGITPARAAEAAGAGAAGVAAIELFAEADETAIRQTLVDIRRGFDAAPRG